MGKLQTGLIKHTFFKNMDFSCKRKEVFNSAKLFKEIKVWKKAQTNTDQQLEDLPDYLLEHLRGCVCTLNTNRSKFIYSRGLAYHAIIFLQRSSISELIFELNSILGNQYSFTEGINFLNYSREAIVNLGIILNGLRFIIDLIFITKHIVLTKNKEELSVKEVLKQEMEKRGFTMGSDLMGIIASLVTTYNKIFHISPLIVSPIIVSFLTLDTLFLFAQWIWGAHKYNKQLKDYIDQQKEATALKHYVIQRQIDVLNDEWRVQYPYFALKILAANIIVISFALSMLCTSTCALAGLAFFSMVGNALVNTIEEYKRYRKSAIAVQRELANGRLINDAHHHKLLKVLSKECNQKYVQFWNSLEFNVVGISFLITAAAASWPVALALTFFYVLYRFYDEYEKNLHEGSNQKVNYDVYRILNPDPVEISETTCPYTRF